MIQKIYFKVDRNINDSIGEMRSLDFSIHKDCFLFILEGKIETVFAEEDFTFEYGPFTYIGLDALKVKKNQPEMVKDRDIGISRQVIQEEDESIMIENVEKVSVLDNELAVPGVCISQASLIKSDKYKLRADMGTLYMKIPRRVYQAAQRASNLRKKVRGEDVYFKDEAGKITDRLDKKSRSIGSDIPLNYGTFIDSKNYMITKL